MKKKQASKKLSLNKLQIARISNLIAIKGGNQEGNTDDLTKTVPTETK